MRHVFVVPEPTAMVSGGNVYNAGLTTALRAAGADVTLQDRLAPPVAAGAVQWVDSLYLDALPSLRRDGVRTNLVVHYLPTLVARGAVPAAGELTAVEQAALDAADGFLVPSELMRAALRTLGVERPILVVAPGLEVPAAQPTVEHERLHAVVVANVTPGKRVLPLVAAVNPAWPIALSVAGSVTMDPDYARACRDAAPQVRFTGALPHEAVGALVAASDVLVSPSCMESFGLALAEARALGVPILARGGGNSAAHVEARAGGRLFDDDAALAADLARLAGDRDERRRRRAAAQAHRPAPRGWADAARDFLDAQRRAAAAD